MLAAWIKLITRNALRAKLRTTLTALGLTVAITAFGLLSTVIEAWYANANAASATRLITRNAISLTFSLPLAYRNRVLAVDGVQQISYANWFGGIYKEPKNFFPQFAIEPTSYLALYPEYVIEPTQKLDFLRDRKGALVGRKIADTYGFKVGDNVSLIGQIYSGDWAFTIRGIYDGAQPNTDTTQFFFHWDYLNERMKTAAPTRVNQIGVFVVGVQDAGRVADISLAVDQEFKNSQAETLTETEKAFQLGFVAMTEAIVIAIRIVSFVVIIIIMVVLANTIAMTARERYAEYATLQALGFPPVWTASLIVGESFTIAILGGISGMLLTYPIVEAFGKITGTLFPVMHISSATLLAQTAATAVVALIAALFPFRTAWRLPIVDGLRHIG